VFFYYKCNYICVFYKLKKLYQKLHFKKFDRFKMVIERKHVSNIIIKKTCFQLILIPLKHYQKTCVGFNIF